MIGIITALISGALMSIQGVFNTEVTKNTSVWVSSTWVQFTALIVCVCAWFFTGRESFAGIVNINQKYMLLGGVFGAFITYTVIKSMGLLGPAKAVMIIVISQLLIAYLIELFGMFGVEKVDFEWKKLLGMALAIGGVVLFKWE
jgi:transporter family-2 protein